MYSNCDIRSKNPRLRLAIWIVHIGEPPGVQSQNQSQTQRNLHQIQQGSAIYAKQVAKIMTGKMRVLPEIVDCPFLFSNPVTYTTKPLKWIEKRYGVLFFKKMILQMRKAAETIILQSRKEPIPEPWTETPVWIEKIYQDRGINGLARFYKPDIWHNIQMGVGKDFSASAICLLVQLLPGSNIDVRFEALSSMYKSWCKQHKKVKYLTKIDKHTVGGCGKRDEPGASWNKAAVTVNMLEFIGDFCKVHEEKCNEDQRLRFIAAAAKAVNTFMKGLYSNDLWIPSSTASEIAKAGKYFVQAYMYSAYLSAKVGEPKFPLKPKLHMVHEAAIWLAVQSETSTHCLNCLAESCSIDEDFVGRVAFITRHVSPRLMSIRSVERYLTQIKLAWTEK